MTNVLDAVQIKARNKIVAASQDEQVVALAAAIEAQIGYVRNGFINIGL